MSRLTRDGPAEPVSRDQILRRERGQRNVHFSCSAGHEQVWQPYPVDPYSCYICDHACLADRRTTFDSPLLKPTGTQIATKPLPGPTTREHRKHIGIKTMSLGTSYSFTGVLPACQNLNYKLQRRQSNVLPHPPKPSKVTTTKLAIGGLHDDKLCNMFR